MDGPKAKGRMGCISLKKKQNLELRRLRVWCQSAG